MASLTGGSTVGGYLILHQGMTTDLLNAIKQVDGSGSGLDADLLDGHEETYFLDWTNTTNKPAPTITLAGDLTGSITLTNLASGTLNATVVDDSHNHIISNVDNLQDALDGKAPLAHAHGNITNAGAIGTASGLAVLTTTSGVLTTGVIPITSGGTGATTASNALVNLGITTTASVLNSLSGLTATIAELNTLDGILPTVTELNYCDGVTSNIQTQLNTKAPLASPIFTGITKGDFIEETQYLGSISGGHTVVASSGTIATATIAGETQLTFNASSDSGYCRVLTLVLTNGGAYTVTWPSSVKWAGGVTPVLSATGVSIIHFITVDNGTLWYGCLGGVDFK